jgi:hypothetical protein
MLLKSVSDYGEPVEVTLETGRKEAKLVIRLVDGDVQWPDPENPASLFPSYDEDRDDDGHLMRGRMGEGLRQLATSAAKLEVWGGGSSALCVGGSLSHVSAGDVPGLVIEATLPWTPSQALPVLAHLAETRLEQGLVVNDEVVVADMEPLMALESELETVIFDGDDHLRVTRKATLLVWESGEGDGLIREMGFPLEQIRHPFVVDVLQRIPMTPKRRAEDLWTKNVMLRILDTRAREMERGA